MSKASETKTTGSTAKSSEASIWSRFEGKRRREAEPVRQTSPTTTPRKRQFRWVVYAVLPLTLTLVAGIAVLLPASLPPVARLSLFAFALAVILWSTTSINAAYVALATVMLLIISGGSDQEALYEALESDVVWLMIGAFVLGGAVQQTGLAARLTGLVVARARTVSSLFWLLTTMLIPLSFVIPSTSGRAAVVIPVFRSIANAAGDRRITRALALLMPTVILVATISTLIGAGSHLIANDLLDEIADVKLSYAQWALYGVPFGIAASYISCWVIMRLFLDKNRRDRKLEIPQQRQKPFSQAERTTLIVVLVMVALWLTESWHGLEIATVTVIGALVLTAPGIGVISWKDGLKAVSWNLIIFVGAALVLGEALIESKAAEWIINQLFAVSGIVGAESRLLMSVSSSVNFTHLAYIYDLPHSAGCGFSSSVVISRQ